MVVVPPILDGWDGERGLTADVSGGTEAESGGHGGLIECSRPQAPGFARSYTRDAERCVNIDADAPQSRRASSHIREKTAVCRNLYEWLLLNVEAPEG